MIKLILKTTKDFLSVYLKVAIITAFVFVILIIVNPPLLHEFQQKEDKYKKQIGQKFVLDKDTLTIINYSMFTGTFELSNGKMINQVLIVK